MQNLRGAPQKSPSPALPRISPHTPSRDIEALLRKLAAELDLESHVPLYRQVAAKICSKIDSGLFLPGEQLPPERRMTELLSVSRRTIRAALSELISQEYIAARHGSGNYIQEPSGLRSFCFLALERFLAHHWGAAPYHYDLIHEAESGGSFQVHYKYAPTMEKFSLALRNPPMGSHGILIFRPEPEWEDWLLTLSEEKLQQLPVPVLVAARDLTGSRLNFVSADHFQQTREATAKLAALGHRQIAYISAEPTYSYLRRTHEGYLQGLKDHDLPQIDEHILLLPVSDRATVDAKILAFLQEGQFTAVIVAGSAFSGPFEKAVQKSAVVIPDQLSAILITEDYILNELTMRWTSFLYPNTEIVHRSLEALADLHLGRGPSLVQELIPHRVIEGATCSKCEN